MKITRNPWMGASGPPLGLRVIDSGYVRMGPEWASGDVRSPFNRLYYTAGGEGRIVCRGQAVPLEPCSVCLIPAGLRFAYACEDSMRQLYFHVSVLPKNGLELFDGCPRPMCLPMDAARLDTLLARYRSGKALDAFCLQTSLREDIARFIRAAALDEAALRADSPLVTAVFEAAQAGLSARLTISDLAGRLSMSSSTLAKRFRQEAGLPLGRYIDGLLLQAAQRLLVTTDSPIGEIAEALSFCDQFYFSRYFKQRLGETPSRYRRKHLTHV